MAFGYQRIRREDDARTLREQPNNNDYSLWPETRTVAKNYKKKLQNVSLPGFKPEERTEVSAMGSSGAQQPDHSAEGATSAADMHFDYDEYVKSDRVLEAEELLAAYQANKPGDFNFGKQSQLDEIIDQILNRDKFSYDLNSDALYKQYAQQYAQQGKMAMMDTMGQAAAMTGGYGNSYAQTVGQQTYQGYLQQLNDVVPELYGMAYDQYQQEGQNMLNQYGLLSGEREQEYGVYRDQVSDYYTELQRLTEEARYLSEDEYNKYLDDLNMKYGVFSDEKSYKYQTERDTVADQQWAREFEEMQRQYNEKMAAAGGSGDTETYEMSPSEYQQWDSMWKAVEDEREAKLLRHNMLAAGVPEELAFAWYAYFMGDDMEEEGPTDTTVAQTVKLPSGGGGGRLGGGPAHVKQ